MTDTDDTRQPEPTDAGRVSPAVRIMQERAQQARADRDAAFEELAGEMTPDELLDTFGIATEEIER